LSNTASTFALEPLAVWTCTVPLRIETRDADGCGWHVVLPPCAQPAGPIERLPGGLQVLPILSATEQDRHHDRDGALFAPLGIRRTAIRSRSRPVW
jgi:hypothetical protein